MQAGDGGRRLILSHAEVQRKEERQITKEVIMENLIQSLAENLTKDEKGKCYKSHFDDYHANLYFGLSEIAEKAFNAGNGQEFKSRKDGSPSKASALHSSSMLACNFFDWMNVPNNAGYKICIGGRKYSKAYFEVKIPTLSKPKPTYANMDVMLVSNDGRRIAFIESKFTEHLSCAASELYGRFASAYTDINRYYVGCCAEEWKNVVKKWKVYAQNRMIGNKNVRGYYNGIKQDICHLIAIGNLKLSLAARNKFIEVNKKTFDTFEIASIEDFDFINLVYEPNKNFTKDRRRCEWFKTLCLEFFRDVPKAIQIKPKFCTYSDLWNNNSSIMGNIRRTSSTETLKDFLERRYMRFSSARESDGI